MITLNQAVDIYTQKYPERIILSVMDVCDEWVFSAGDKESGLELDESPIAIHKESGEMRIFFPPFNVEKLKKATMIELSEIK